MLIAVLARGATTAPVSLSPDQAADSKKLAADFSDRLQRSRYMESGESKEMHVPGWEKFPTRRYHYSVTDKNGPVNSTVKSADVVMLNPSADQIARWIVSALVEVKGAYAPEDGQRIFKHIIAQSGGQFPIAGVVYEDILPADGVNEIFCFRDGVTVQVEGVKHRGTEPMTPEQIEASISGKVTRVFTYARIQSTTPQQFIDAGGAKDVLKDGKPTDQWMAEIRKAYQEAWGKDRNLLMVAWVKGNSN